MAFLEYDVSLELEMCLFNNILSETCIILNHMLIYIHVYIYIKKKNEQKDM